MSKKPASRVDLFPAGGGNAMNGLFRRLAWWRRRRVTEKDLQDELAFHLAEEAAERQDEGVSAPDARRSAHLDLGNVLLIREDVRALWTWTTVEQFLQDARYALRTMVRYRLAVGLAIVSLALGIGANTAIYSFMDALLFRALPVPEPESLAAVTWRAKPFRNAPRESSQFVLRGINGSTYRDTSGVTASILPFPAFERLHEASGSVFSAVFAYRSAGRLNVIVRGEAEVATGEYVTGGFFSGLQIVPIAGRGFLSDEDRDGAPPTVVLSSGYSARRFGSASAAIGQAVLINNIAFTVIGVAPEHFSGIDPATVPDVYLPLRSAMLLEAETPERFFDPNYYWLNMMGRLRSGVRLADAQTALATPFEQWVRSTATTSAELANLPVLKLESGAGGLDTLRRRFSQPVYVLLAMVGLILAIACANTANLLLARSTTRRREIAVRLAIGAGRLRIIRQLLTESVVLALVSGGLGVLVAFVSIQTLSRLLANGQEANGQLDAIIDARLDWRVLGVTLVLSIACGFLFGLAPALQSTKPSLLPALKNTSRADQQRRPRLWPRLTVMQTLIVSQLVMSLLLLVAAGLFARTLTNLESVELGFDPDQVLLFDVNAAQTGRSASETAAFYADLRQRLSEAPGVRDATLAHASIIGAGRGLAIEVDGARASVSRVLNAGPAFLKTMGIRVLRGRDLEDRDAPGALPVVVISDLFARTYFPQRDPIGQRIHLAMPTPADFEVVGVAAEAHYGGLRRDVPPIVYMPYNQTPFPPLGQMTFIVRTDADPLQYGSVVRDIVRRADARVPVMRMRTQAQEIEQTLNQEIIFARLCAAFAMLALVMACIGLYGTMAYGVTRRTQEIGIRLALGARQRTVMWTVLREVCALAAVGLAISVPLALLASRLVQSFLFDVKPNDPYTIVSAVGVLILAALVAGFGPARRAARISPSVALRAD
jgi:macrolide transport system ATP-binding/permease protein